MSTINEVVIYIHGVSNELRGRSHNPEYKSLHDGIGNISKSWPSKFIGTEWGWNYKDVINPKSHELLTDAQRLLGDRAIKAVDDPWDFTINPGRMFLGKLRSLIMYGFSDMFYYVSKDGKKAVRNAVASQIVKKLAPLLKDQNKPNLSLTLLGHSAGSVVAFDLIFYFFFSSEPNFLFDRKTKAEQDLFTALSNLRKLAQNNKLRIRRLITFGSPITSMAFRSDAILDVLAANGELDPADYGLDRNPKNFGSPLKGPRWINIWDKDDPIAWPVEPLMKESSNRKIVSDVYIDVSDSISESHNKYWESTKVHEAIADSW